MFFKRQYKYKVIICTIQKCTKRNVETTLPATYTVSFFLQVLSLYACVCVCVCDFVTSRKIRMVCLSLRQELLTGVHKPIDVHKMTFKGSVKPLKLSLKIVCMPSHSLTCACMWFSEKFHPFLKIFKGVCDLLRKLRITVVKYQWIIVLSLKVKISIGDSMK